MGQWSGIAIDEIVTSINSFGDMIQKFKNTGWFGSTKPIIGYKYKKGDVVRVTKSCYDTLLYLCINYDTNIKYCQNCYNFYKTNREMFSCQCFF